jgi:hypothetical protein
MSLWAKVRGLPITGVAIVATLLGLVLPVSTAAATPSPAGATLAAACLVALAVPVAVGWGCARGDASLEAVSIQPVRAFDLLLAIAAVGLTAGMALLLEQAGIAPAGAIAARAALVYLGLVLLATPLSWRIATLAPAIYLLAVAVVGGGADIDHPALWAWIAAQADDPTSWLLTAGTLVLGILVYLLVPRRFLAGAAESPA